MTSRIPMRFLIVPEVASGRGTGHLKRSFSLLKELPSAALFVPPFAVEKVKQVASSLLAQRGVLDHVIQDLGEHTFEKIVIDRFSIDPAEVAAFSEHGCVIGIDLGGEGRRHADYLIDFLPRTDATGPNEYDPGYLDLPRLPRTGSGNDAGRILVTFGGEDRAALAEETALALTEIGVNPALLSVVEPTLRSLGALPRGVNVLPPQRSLAGLFMDHEWVLTLFGLTAYEAASCGCKVVTIAPSPYHKELAVAAGFASAGIGHPNKEVLSDLLETGSLVEKKSRETVPPESKSIASRLIELPTGMGRGCPVHGTRGPAIYRDREKSYFRCPRCRLVYMERFAEDRESYQTSYFMEEYKRQYGKTYLEDFSSIKSMGRERVSRIRRLRPRNGNLLDIGCAYGPFLAAASEAGFEPAGLDVSTSAVRYVVDELGFPCIEGSILSDDAVRQLPRSTFGVVTLWFVIEHFRDLDALLSRLSSLVEPGGVLAFSTPHGQGVSARSAPEQFCERSPRDHFTVWDRQSAKAVLAEFGFQVETIRVTGHHPERYPGVAAGRLPKAIAAIHSKLFGWGDTFEVYARRVSREAVIV